MCINMCVVCVCINVCVHGLHVCVCVCINVCVHGLHVCVCVFTCMAVSSGVVSGDEDPEGEGGGVGGTEAPV